VKEMVEELTCKQAVFRMVLYAIGIFIFVPLVLKLFNDRKK